MSTMARVRRTIKQRLGAEVLGSVALLGAVAAWLPASGAASDEIVVAAAASLRDPVTRIAERFRAPDRNVTLSFGASNLLAGQIELGAPVDVFLSADPDSVARLERSGRVVSASRREFAGNRLVVLRAPDFAGRLESPHDLARLRRVALPHPTVPLGRYTRQWLATHGLEAALEDRSVRTPNARATLAAVDLGQVDAAIVYQTDAALARSARVAFDIPASEQPRIAYVAALTERASGSRKAHDFLEFLLGPGGRPLRAAGFETPPGTGSHP
jgi:molybdate transport system substrate-binding protein